MEYEQEKKEKKNSMMKRQIGFIQESQRLYIEKRLIMMRASHA